MELNVPDDFEEIKWTETARMRCLAIGPKIYLRRELLSLAKFAIGFCVFFCLITCRNRQLWPARGVDVVILGASLGFFYRLVIGVRSAFIRLSRTTLGRNSRGFSIAACKAFTVTQTRGLLRFEFDGPNRRGIRMEHFVIAAPQTALPYLARLATTELDANIDHISMPDAAGTSPFARLDSQPEPVNPVGGALFGIGFPLALFGAVMLAAPIVDYFVFGLKGPLLLLTAVISWPIGIVLIAIGIYCIRVGLPSLRQQIDLNQRTKTLK